MRADDALRGMGLSSGEIKVYLALLKLGSVPAGKLKEETKLHRTTIYDFIEKLLNKGMVNYVIKNNVKCYKASHPSKLLEIVKEKEENIQQILPDLIKLTEFVKEEIKVEVYKGVEGFKTILNDRLKVGGDMVAFGIDEAIFKERFRILMEQYIKRAEGMGLKERLLTSEKARFIFKTKISHYRYIPEEFFNPTPVAVYGNKVDIIIWEPFTVIMIENANLADSFKKYFELLWNMAKEKA